MQLLSQENQTSWVVNLVQFHLVADLYSPGHHDPTDVIGFNLLLKDRFVIKVNQIAGHRSNLIGTDGLE